MRVCSFRFLVSVSASFALCWSAQAGPWVAPGDMALRHDIQTLADAGVIKAPVTSWPLSWGDVLNDIADYRDPEGLSDAESEALLRVRRIGSQATRRRIIQAEIDAHYDTEPGLLRGFEDRAREDTDIAVSAGWLGDRFAAEIVVNGVSSPDDDQDVRLDGSYVGVAIGNYMVSAGAMERWWGPGYDGSIILGNNQRPIPAISIERNDTAPFKSKWLSWLGHWDASFVWGQLENERAVPNARFLGLRLNFKPLDSLEIGLSRTAQWCGSGDRPCDLDTLVKLAIGRDNLGDEGVDIANEPGNQLAGVDVRWSPKFAPLNGAAYLQLIGEDEAGGLPSRFLGQLGFEVAGVYRDLNYRAFAEYAGTACQFYEDSSRPNCGYNSLTYETGYRYKGRSIGHSADNDAEVLSVGAVIAERDGDVWQVVLRDASLNTEGEPDFRNTISSVPAEYSALEISYRKEFAGGLLELGGGLSRFEDNVTGESNNDSRLFIGWRMPF
ncbi:MAG: capsule assembly Wzi family protein [Pseudomonadota bacterium]